MKGLFEKYFLNIVFSLKKHKTLSIFILIGSVTAIILGIIGGIRINHSLFPQDFSNVSYVKFLKGSGFVGFYFSNLLTILVFALFIWLFCYKSFLALFALLFIFILNMHKL